MDRGSLEDLVKCEGTTLSHRRHGVQMTANLTTDLSTHVPPSSSSAQPPPFLPYPTDLSAHVPPSSSSVGPALPHPRFTRKNGIAIPESVLAGMTFQMLWGLGYLNVEGMMHRGARRGGRRRGGKQQLPAAITHGKLVTLTLTTDPTSNPHQPHTDPHTDPTPTPHRPAHRPHIDSTPTPH